MTTSSATSSTTSSTSTSTATPAVPATGHGVRIRGLTAQQAGGLRDRAREQGRSAVLVDAPHSYPCRACLRDAEPGERVLLVRHDPFGTQDGASPYTATSPVYLHEEPCPVDPPEGDVVPGQLLRRLLSVRAYDARDLMLAADVVEGTGLRDLARSMLADPEVAYLHVHNARAGCWAARLERA